MWHRARHAAARASTAENVVERKADNIISAEVVVVNNDDTMIRKLTINVISQVDGYMGWRYTRCTGGWAAMAFFGKTTTSFFSILSSIPSYTIFNKQYTICNSRIYFSLPRFVFDGWRLLSEALFCNRTTCPLIIRLRLSQLFCPLLINWYTFQIDDQNKDKNRQLTNIGYSWTLPWLKNCSVA